MWSVEAADREGIAAATLAAGPMPWQRILIHNLSHVNPRQTSCWGGGVRTQQNDSLACGYSQIQHRGLCVAGTSVEADAILCRPFTSLSDYVNELEAQSAVAAEVHEDGHNGQDMQIETVNGRLLPADM